MINGMNDKISEICVQLQALERGPDLGTKARVKFKVEYAGDLFVEVGHSMYRLWRAEDGNVQFYDDYDDFIEMLSASCPLGHTLLKTFPEWFELEN